MQLRMSTTEITAHGLCWIHFTLDYYDKITVYDNFEGNVSQQQIRR